MLPVLPCTERAVLVGVWLTICSRGALVADDVPNWVRRNPCPPIRMLPLRAWELVFGAREYITVPLFELFKLERMLIQELVVTTLHAQPVCVATATMPVPPAYPCARLPGEIEMVQFVGGF